MMNDYVLLLVGLPALVMSYTCRLDITEPSMPHHTYYAVPIVIVTRDSKLCVASEEE